MLNVVKLILGSVIDTYKCLFEPNWGLYWKGRLVLIIITILPILTGFFIGWYCT